MKVFELIRALQMHAAEGGTQNSVFIETGDKKTGRRVEQGICDVLLGNDRILLVSAEANELDPLNSLPICPDGPDSSPQQH